MLGRPYWVSDQRVPAFTLVAVALLLNGAIQAAGVVFSYVNRDMMTALADRDGTTFFHKMLLAFTRCCSWSSTISWPGRSSPSRGT